MDGRSNVDTRFQRHTAVTGTCFRYGHLGELRRGVRQVTRAGAGSVAC